mgnify:CR=1 FL=1
MKKILSMLLVFAMALTCCFGAVASAEADKVVVGITIDPGNIGPFQGMSAGRIGILFTTYEFLVTKVNGERVNCLAKEITQVDEKTVDVEIYDYIVDQAGNPLTAADVAWSYQSGMDSGNLPKLAAIASVEAKDDYTVRFVFNELSAGDLDALLMECPIVTRAAYEASPDQMATDPVTTSAYQVTEYVSGSKIVYKNTGKYWQTDDSLVPMTSRHNVENIEIDIIPDTAQLTNALKTRAIDVSVWISATDIADFKDQPGFTVSKMPENTTELFLFNCSEKSVFANNPDLRKAIAYAIDSELIAEGAYNGDARPVKTYGNTKYADYVESWNDEPYYEYDFEKAKELYAASGASNLNLKLMYVTSDETAMMATIIQAELAELGINVELCGYDSQLFNQYKFDGADQWDLMLDEGASSTNLANVYKLAWDRNSYTHGGALNYVKDDQLQSLLEAAMNEKTHNDETMNAFHQYLKEQCYGIGLVQKLSNVAHTDTIKTLETCFRGQVLPGACEY